MNRLEYLYAVLNEEPLTHFGRKLVLAEIAKLRTTEENEDANPKEKE